MFSEFIQSRIGEIRKGLEKSETTAGDTRQAEKVLDALEQGLFCFRAEAWHDIAHGKAGQPVNEMLLHIPDEQSRPADMYKAMHAIYDRGFFRQMDEIIVACVLQQAEALDQFPVSINLSVHSACCKAFWKDIAPLLSRFPRESVVFEILESEYVPTPVEIRTLRALRHMGYRFALDDIAPGLRDMLRLKALGGVVDYIKICGTMIESWELGHAGLISFMGQVRAMCPEAVLVAEWVSSVAYAHHLSKIGFHAVQGRNLPAERERFDALYRKAGFCARCAHEKKSARTLRCQFAA